MTLEACKLRLLKQRSMLDQIAAQVAELHHDNWWKDGAEPPDFDPEPRGDADVNYNRY